MLHVVRRLRYLSQGATLLLLLAGCGTGGPTPGAGDGVPAGSKPVSISTLSEVGPGIPSGNPVPVAAALQLADLQGQLEGIREADYRVRPNFFDCQKSKTPGDEAICWRSVAPSGDTVLIAARINVECSDGSDARSSISGSILTISVTSKGGHCGNGTASAAVPGYSLLSLPRSDLPSTLVTIRLKHLEIGLNPLVIYSADTLIDLRPPPPAAMDPATRAAEVFTAIGLARDRASSQFGSSARAVEVAAVRLSSSDPGGCPRPDSSVAGAVGGYWVGIAEGTTGTTVHHYRVVAGTAESCR
jgi:hypothetical protein